MPIISLQISDDLLERFEKVRTLSGFNSKSEALRDAIVSFIETYEKFETNILNYFDNRVTSGPVEEQNNKIKVIKRRGFGFRNVLQFAQRLFLDINLRHDLLPTP